ncbi:unnamed protein product, partial [marine sediment metagenome]
AKPQKRVAAAVTTHLPSIQSAKSIVELPDENLPSKIAYKGSVYVLVDLPVEKFSEIKSRIEVERTLKASRR